MEARGRHESARRPRSVCSRVFRYAIPTGRAENDPTANLREALTASKVTRLAAITDANKVGPLLREIAGVTGDELTRAALQLAPHVFVRPGELRQAGWEEWELDRALWLIPDAIERQLDHVDTDNVRRAYARGGYWDERVEMMQAWSEYLDRLAAENDALSTEMPELEAGVKTRAPAEPSYFFFDPRSSASFAVCQAGS